TVINALAPMASAKTGNKPGVTKGRQWVKTNVGIELLDTPGMLWPKFASEDTAFKLAVCGSISDLVLPLDEISFRLAVFLLKEAPAALQERYKLQGMPANPAALFAAIAQARGMLGVGGKLRTEDAAVVLLQEFRAGRLGRFTLDPPGGMANWE
ncbi:MAG: GTPase, partial [Clostridiales bacterium]